MGIALIMKYFINKNIQSIFLENKYQISEKQLEHMICVGDLKKKPKTERVKVQQDIFC